MPYALRTSLSQYLSLAALLMGAATGCAGASTDVVARSAVYPISLSRGVRDASGELVTSDRREVVGHVDIAMKAWAMLYSAINFDANTDISDEINRQTRALNGDAVVNTTISTKSCVQNYFYPLTVLPFWPGCIVVHVRGDVIRVRRPKAPPAVRDGVEGPSAALGGRP